MGGNNTKPDADIDYDQQLDIAIRNSLHLNGLTENEELCQDLECPICYETCKPPIFMCSNRHIVCSTCRSQIDECSICREPRRPSTRNWNAEKLTGKVIVSCTNTDDGCNRLFGANDLPGHLLTCSEQFRYPCRLGIGAEEICRWAGSRRQLREHVRAAHADSYSEATSTDARLLVYDEDNCQRWCVSAHDQLFWVSISHDAELDVTSLCADYVGGPENAVRYECRFDLRSTEGDVSHICRTRKPTDRYPISPTVFSLDREYLDMFLEDGELKCKVSISKRFIRNEATFNC